jgi:hypothetical protein
MSQTAMQSSRDRTEPALGLADITPSNSTTYKPCLRSVYIGGAGNLRVRGVNGGTVTFTNVPAGSILPIQVDQVLLTGTTATGIIGLY